MACETAAGQIAISQGKFPMEALGLTRIIETMILTLIVFTQKQGLGIIGLSRHRMRPGIAAGILCAFIFAVIAAAGLGLLAVIGYQPFDLIRVPLPSLQKDLYVFFVVGGIIAPVAEELFFRGILFGYISNWSVPGAVFMSSLIFLFFHPQGGVIQLTGGLVFALAYHFSQSLAAPVIIHSLGNLSLFTLSLITRG